MSKPEQILGLDPPVELRFRGPFTDVVTSDLKLSNGSNRRVCFKVKTTAPKRYCVRPNSGIIDPGSKVTVAVMLQPFDYDPNEKNKHKFMVQTMFAPDGQIDSQEALTQMQDTLWKEATPDKLMDSKLKCVFELPNTDNAWNNLDANVSADEKANLKSNTPEKAASPKVSNVDSDVRKYMDDNKRLSGEIQRLRDENGRLKDEGLRLRKVAMSDTTSSTPAGGATAAVEPTTNALPPIVYLVAAVILGLILGKFIL